MFHLVVCLSVYCKRTEVHVFFLKIVFIILGKYKYAIPYLIDICVLYEIYH